MDANCAAVERMLAVEPVWVALEPASELLGLEPYQILHAGPPLADPTAPPAPILNAAVIACLYERWADDEMVAERLIRSGRVRLGPAQDRGAATPLAAVISPSMPMQVIADAANSGREAASPLSSGVGPQLRFGARDPEIVERLRWRENTLAVVLRRALAEPLPLIPLAATAMRNGDDLHARTSAATGQLQAALARRIGEEAGFADVLAHIYRSRLFFVNIWMAACKCILRAAEAEPGSTVVTAMGGNGTEFGIQLAGRAGEWVTVPAASPKGPRLRPELDGAVALGALGDSALIDALGFGGQALGLAPRVLMALGPYAPRGLSEIPERLLLAPHPAFASVGLRVALDARRVLESGVRPVVALSMIDAKGQAGMIGRGTYRPPLELFANAVARVSAEAAS